MSDSPVTIRTSRWDLGQVDLDAQADVDGDREGRPPQFGDLLGSQRGHRGVDRALGGDRREVG